MATNRRPDRVSEAIREEVAVAIAAGSRDPRISPLVTVTGAEVTRDLRQAKIFVSVLGSDEERQATLEGLEAMAPRLRGQVGRALRLRVAPQLLFRLDQSVANAARIETLLQQIKNDDAARAADAPPSGDGDAAG
jgi:ribosome-binding factor A